MKKKFYKHKIESLINVSKIVTVHYFNLRPRWKSRGEAHDFWEMVFIEKGRLVCEVDGKEVTLSEGGVIFHKPNEYHVHKTLDDHTTIFIISFECKSEAMELLADKSTYLERDLVKFIYIILNNASSTFDIKFPDPGTTEMQMLSRPSLGGLQVIKNILEVLLISVLREGEDGEGGEQQFILKKDFDEAVSAQVIEYLTSRIYERISVDEICRNLNYTRSHLFRKFKHVTGSSIMAYFTSLKISEAKRLLRETELSVTDIADKLAFDTPNYFSKTFKRISGYTPLEYKKMRRLPNR